MQIIKQREGESLVELALRCGALYVCPKVGLVRKGPLVAYAGKDVQGRNFVGDVYFNFRRIEQHLEVVSAFAHMAIYKISVSESFPAFDTICGIPNGGRSFGQELARRTETRFVYPDKTPKPTESGKKQEYTWDLKGFEFEKGERIVIAEDAVHNFQNTDNTLEQVPTGVNVVGIVCALNRSLIHGTEYTPKTGRFAGKPLPIIASIRERYPEYPQDDPYVAGDINAGNIVWEAKQNWSQLIAHMQQPQQ